MRDSVFFKKEGLRIKKGLECWLNLALEYNKKVKATPKRTKK